MEKQNCITIRYDITEVGIATYNETDGAKIKSYMEEADCSIEEAIWELANVGAIAGYPEEIGKSKDYGCTYMEEETETE